MPTDIKGLSDEELLDEYGAVSWRAEPEEGPYQEQLYNELLNRMSGAGWRSVEEGDPDDGEYLLWLNFGEGQPSIIEAGYRLHGNWYTTDDTRVDNWIEYYQDAPNPPEEG